MSDDRPHWLVRATWAVEMRRGRFHLPARGFLGDLLFYGRPFVVNSWGVLMQALVREPALRRRCQRLGRTPRLLGAGPFIMGEGHLEIGDDLELGPECSLTVGIGRGTGAAVHIGDHVHIGLRNTICAATGIHIGDHVRTGSYVSIYDTDLHSHEALPRRVDAGPLPTAPVRIEDDVWLGVGATVLKGVTIGRGAIVGAGAVVVRDVPPFTVVAGNPAVPVGQAPPAESQPNQEARPVSRA